MSLYVCLSLCLTLLAIPAVYKRLFGLERAPARGESLLRGIQFVAAATLALFFFQYESRGLSGLMMPVRNAALVLLCLGYLEVLARVCVKYAFPAVGRSLPVVAKLYRYIVDDPEDMYYTKRVPHPFLQYTGPRNKVPDGQGDSYIGFKELKVSDVPKRPGVLRIACLGGSTTEDGYPEILQELLAEKGGGKRYEILNFGRTWWSSTHSMLNYVLNVREFEPDYLIIHHNCNDHHYRGFSGLRGDCSHAYRVFSVPTGADEALFRFSLIYRILRMGLFLNFPSLFKRNLGMEQIGLNPGKTYHYDPKELRIFRRNIMTMVDLARAQSSEVLLLTMPYSNARKYSEEHDKVYRPHLRQVNELLRGVAKEENLTLVDLDDLMTGQEEYFWDPVHVTVEGNRAKARAVGDAIMSRSGAESK